MDLLTMARKVRLDPHPLIYTPTPYGTKICEGDVVEFDPRAAWIPFPSALPWVVGKIERIVFAVRYTDVEFMTPQNYYEANWRLCNQRGLVELSRQLFIRVSGFAEPVRLSVKHHCYDEIVNTSDGPVPNTKLRFLSR